jgi:hypothetical protein
MVCVKHRGREAVRLHVEECEPRLVPQGDGTWHALVQQAKMLDQAYRQHANFNATDPYCNGTDAGPCAAWPDLVRLRAELYQFADLLHGAQDDSLGQYQTAADNLEMLQQQHAPFAQIHQAQLQVEYWDGYHSYAETDYTDVSTSLPHTDDAHLVALANRLITENGSDRHDHWLDLEKTAKRQRREDLDNHAAAGVIANDEYWEAHIRGVLDENELYFNAFVETVQ